MSAVDFTDPMAAALWLAGQGYRVFEVDHPSLPTCAGMHGGVPCDGTRGKHPAVPFTKQATTDAAEIFARWSGTTRNVGVFCGGPSADGGLLVVDEDEFGELARFCQSIGVTLPVTFTVVTARGKHYYFRVPEGLRFGNREGAFGEYAINVRAGNALVVGPGSRHASGHVYVPEDESVPAALMPAWLVDALTPRRPVHEAETLDDYAGPVHDGLDPAERARVDRYVATATEGELTRLDACADAAVASWSPFGHSSYAGPDWNSTAFEVACNLAELARSPWNGYTFEQAEADHAKRAPRDPGFDDDTIAALWTRGVEQTAGKVRNFPAGPERLELFEAAVAPASSTSLSRALDWSTFMDADDTEPVWLAGQIAEQGEQVALVGGGKVGKSLFCLDWAAAIASGTSFLDDEQREPVGVLYVDQENTARDLRRRVRALGLDPSGLGRLTYLSFPPYPMLDTAAGGAALLADVRSSGARVVYLDTVSRMITGNENDSETWLSLYRHTLMPLKAEGVTVVRLDHTGKDQEKGARGSSAKTQDVDRVWELRKSSATKLRLIRTHSRTGLGDEVVNLIRLGESGEVGTTRHIRESLLLEVTDPEIAAAVATLADHGVPLGLGRDKLRQAADGLETGLKFSNEKWSQIVRARGAGR